jgi:hypothetical protein
MQPKVVFLSLILISSTVFMPASGQVNAQKKIKIFITGAVYDNETKEPLTNAHFTIHKSENYSTLSNGRFSLFGNPGDTIAYRYLGYKEMKVVIPDTLKSLEYLMGVFMPKDTILIPEVVIFPRIDTYPSIITKVSDDPRMVNQAQKNVDKATLQGLTQQVKNYDAEMNAKKTLRGYEMKAQYKGLLFTPENSVSLSTGNYRTNYLQFGSPLVRKKKITNEMINQSEIDLILASYEIMRSDTTKTRKLTP